MIYFVFASILLAVFAQLLMKKGLNDIGTIEVSEINFSTIKILFTNLFIISGIGCYVFGLFFWLIALSDTDVSKLYPLQSIGYVIVLFGAFFFLDEKITPTRSLGVILISLGTFLLLKN